MVEVMEEVMVVIHMEEDMEDMEEVMEDMDMVDTDMVVMDTIIIIMDVKSKTVNKFKFRI